MSRKKNIDIIEEPSSVTALVFGESAAAGYVCALLEEQGCKTTLTSKISPAHTRFDYVIQFGDSVRLEEVYKRTIKSGGKFLFVASFTDEETLSLSHPAVKILFIGDNSLWETKELVGKILKTLFSSSTILEKNARKGTPFIKEPPEPKKQHVTSVQKIIPEKPSVHHKTLPQKRKSHRFLLLVLFIVFFSAGLLGAVVTIYVRSVHETLTSFQYHMNTSDWTSLSKDIRDAKQELRIADMIYQGSYTVLVPFRQAEWMNDAGEILNITRNILTTADDSLSFFSSFRLGSSFTSALTLGDTDFTAAITQINTFKNTLTLLNKRLSVTSLPAIPESITPFLTNSLEKLEAASSILPVVQSIFYPDTVKTYLLLFQNNMELRPTGGFIGSFGLLTVERGKVLDFKIMDVYTADGQLKGHVEPPSAIRKYLSQPNFFLRDSNFDPDFAQSAVTASFFIEKELGTKVDGVIGINLFFLQDLLRLVGDITIPDFQNEIVNADNFFFKAQFFAQQSFFPGSSQKKDFLTAVFHALQEKLFRNSTLPVFDLLLTVNDSLDKKNIVLSFPDESLQKEIESKSWAGRISLLHCVGEYAGNACFADYLSIVESNFGVNKVNYYIEKSVTIEKLVKTDGVFDTNVTVSYENKSIAQVFAGGTYTNYMRFFVPSNSKLIDLTLNQAPILLKDVDKESYGADKESIGFLIRIAPGNKGVVKIKYQNPAGFSQANTSYQFLFQKQAGDKSSPLIFSFINNSKYLLTPVNFKSTSSRETEIFYTTDTSVDRIFALSRK